MKPFAKITEASEILGLSPGYLRGACKRHEIPFLMSGKKVLINLPGTMRTLGVTVDDSEGREIEADI